MAPPLYLSNLASQLSDPTESSLTLLARGLGLRNLICTLLKVFNSPNSLILIVNATAEEEARIGEELVVMGCRKPGLRVVGFEIPPKDRQVLYRKGGLISVTSRILIVDMLLSDIPIEIITGIIVTHAEKVTALDSTAFITRLYRDKNQAGFLKAFSDDPEHITSGLSPLRNILKELQIRTVHIYPRFHEDIQKSLERRKADVIELAQPMSESMSDIHEAIVNCMNATLNELKRSNTTLDLDELDIKSAYFRSFDAMVRRQLDPVWHKVGARTKRLVGDLGVLRRLLTYLLSYDPLSFYVYLETIVASNSRASNSLYSHENQSPWLTMDAAHTIFTVAKRRCYVNIPVSDNPNEAEELRRKAMEAEQDAEWEVLDEIEGVASEKVENDTRPWWEKGKGGRPWWLPKDMSPVLEEPPKWGLLAGVLHEIEQEINDKPGSFLLPGSDTVLVMTSSNQTCSLLREYLDMLDLEAPEGEQGRRMMLQRLCGYLGWKADLHASIQTQANASIKKDMGIAQKASSEATSGDGELNEVMKKDKDRRDRAASRRRASGGAPGVASTSQRPKETEQEGMTKSDGLIPIQPGRIADFFAAKSSALGVTSTTTNVETVQLDDVEFDTNYGLLPPEQTVIIRAYSDDTDDQVLSEIRPRYIVMYEPNQEFLRRIEVYHNANPGLGVRIYFMFYAMSCEEHKYLAGLRREKESFERLIKERGSMLMPILDERRLGSSAGDAIVRTIGSRIAGGGKIATTAQSQVIVDTREFWSTLPNLLHASYLKIIPATLVVGDYILTPDMCVERKSIPDLMSSFNSGRLYTQCEFMSVHYKQPILLIEFEEHKSFFLKTVAEMRSYAKPTGHYPIKKKPCAKLPGDAPAFTSVQSKLVLLTLAFPRVRIIWSSSPYATAEIFNDLKLHNSEPVLSKAIAVGAEDDARVGSGGDNLAAEKLLRSLPGITAKNARYVMGKVASVSELCALGMQGLQEILGVEPGKACWEFIHRGEKVAKV